MRPEAERPFRLRDVALAAYGPTVLNSTGHGAVLPVLALQARELGAGVATAALVVALTGVGTLLAALPSGALVARIGERRALVMAGLVEALALLVAATSRSVPVLALAMMVTGAAWSVFLIARHGFLIDAVPMRLRARAMSTLGGSHRAGLFVGPLVGAATITALSLPAVFVVAAVLSTLSAGLALVMPDLGAQSRSESRAVGHLRVLPVLRSHTRTLATVGMAVLVIMASRSVRTSLLPLWADHVGVSAATTSLVFAVAGGLELLVFYPGGWLMDRVGRRVVAVPVVAATAVACLALPLATSVAGLTAVMVLMALGNGLGSGIVLTLGADVAPTAGRAQFLGGWRLCGDLGNTGAPLALSALAAVVPLAAASLVLGALLTLGTGWVGYWTRQVDRGLTRR